MGTRQVQRTRDCAGTRRRTNRPSIKSIPPKAPQSQEEDLLSKLTRYEVYVLRIAVFVLLVVGVLGILCPEIAKLVRLFADQLGFHRAAATVMPPVVGS